MADNWPATKPELHTHLSDAWAQLQETLAEFSEDDLTARTDHVGWTAKDHLAHLIVWEQGIIALLRREPRYEAMGVDLETVQTRSEDELNEMLRTQYGACSPAKVRERLRNTHEELSRLIDSLDTEDFRRTYSYYQPDEPGEDSGESVMRWVVGNSGGHYLEHLPWIRQLLEGKG